MPTIKTLKQNNEQVAPRTVIDAIVDYDIDEFDDLSTLVNGATYSERI